MMRGIIFGIIGQAAFYFAVPALLYLFFINSFGRRTAVKMRSICTVVFVVLCGCIFHLTVQNQGMATGINLIPDLYLSGVEGISGGIFCGGIALLLKWACGKWVALLVCILAAVLCLLGAVEITIPSLIRAIANRPRPEEEEEEEQEYIEPAVLVVNHIANKRIEKKRQHHARLEGIQSCSMEQLEIASPAQTEAAPVVSIKRVKSTSPAVRNEPEEVRSTTGTPSRAAGVMNTIDLDISAPFARASVSHSPRARRQ